MIYAYGGDFNRFDASDNNFCDNGLISPDRVPNPHMYEVGYFYQNIWTTPGDIGKGEIKIYNENFFRDLSAYRMEWEVMKDGKPVRTGIVDELNVAPGQSVTMKLDLGNIDDCGEWLLNVKYIQKMSENLVPAGHVVAKNQIVLKEYELSDLAFSNIEKSNMKIVVPMANDENSNCLEIVGEAFNIQFDKKNGFMDSYTVNGVQMIKEGGQLTPNFWRAPTDNDYGAELQNKYSVWKNPELKLLSMKHEQKENMIVVCTEYEIRSVHAKLYLTYTINNEGAVKVNQRMAAAQDVAVPDMFRFGMQMVMPESFEKISYYGRGPIENYIDRKHSTDLGIYNQTVTEQFYAYIRPQENGTKTDIRWWKLFNDEGKGLQFVAAEPFSASALHYTIESLDDGAQKDQRHSNEVSPSDLTNFLIDKVQQGLACENSWGAIPRPEYRVPYANYEFTFIMTPVSDVVVIE